MFPPKMYEVGSHICNALSQKKLSLEQEQGGEASNGVTCIIDSWRGFPFGEISLLSDVNGICPQ